MAENAEVTENGVLADNGEMPQEAPVPEPEAAAEPSPPPVPAATSNGATKAEKPPKKRIMAKERHDSGSDRGGDGSSDVKCIYLYRNGDAYFAKKKFIVNKRYVRAWDAFLELITTAVKPRKGAIRSLHSIDGAKVATLEAVRSHESYVCVAGGEKFVVIEYDKIPERPLSCSRSSEHGNSHKQNNKQKVVADGRIQQRLEDCKAKCILVSCNGDEFSKPANILLSKHDQANLDAVLKVVSEKVHLPMNKIIRRMFTRKGQLVGNPSELEEGGGYVVAGTEPFVAKNYGHEMKSMLAGRVDPKMYSSSESEPLKRRSSESKLKRANSRTRTNAIDGDKKAEVASPKPALITAKTEAVQPAQETTPPEDNGTEAEQDAGTAE